ncbi:MAG: double zinc ribbon domain-containing protein [Oscillospiraceae bacterium]|nr:double zinc ribbon domain-containing protein [Oscillospiraceae bacterium]
MTAYNLKRFLLDALYPNRCPFCGELIIHHAAYCPECLDALSESVITAPLEPPDGVSGLIAVFRYGEFGEGVSRFVYSLKDSADGYAITAAARLLSDALHELPQPEVITCVPTDAMRLRERGYNPPALIAREMSVISGLPCDTKLLRKVRETEVQKSLSAAGRRENLRGAFALNKRACPPETVLIIDDVCTTGATLTEAACVLTDAGVSAVYAAVVAVVGRGS